MASHKPSTVRSAVLRSSALSFAKAVSMGFRSGEWHQCHSECLAAASWMVYRHGERVIPVTTEDFQRGLTHRGGHHLIVFM